MEGTCDFVIALIHMQLLLGFLPIDKSYWQSTSEAKRELYAEYKRDLITNPYVSLDRGVSDTELLHNDDHVWYSCVNCMIFSLYVKIIAVNGRSSLGMERFWMK